MEITKSGVSARETSLGYSWYRPENQDSLIKLVTEHELCGKGAFLFQTAESVALKFGLIPDRINAGIVLFTAERSKISKSAKKG